MVKEVLIVFLRRIFNKSDLSFKIFAVYQSYTTDRLGERKMYVMRAYIYTSRYPRVRTELSVYSRKYNKVTKVQDDDLLSFTDECT